MLLWFLSSGLLICRFIFAFLTFLLFILSLFLFQCSLVTLSQFFSQVTLFLLTFNYNLLYMQYLFFFFLKNQPPTKRNLFNVFFFIISTLFSQFSRVFFFNFSFSESFFNFFFLSFFLLSSQFNFYPAGPQNSLSMSFSIV